MAQGETKLLYPGLAGLYQTMLPIAATFVRVVVGIMFLMHVATKFKIGADTVAANVFSKNGIEPALMWAYVVMFLELVGGICLIIGLFTRFVAAALAIEMLVALLFVHLPKGYAAGGGGYEYVLLIGAVCFVIAIRGGVLIRLTAPLARSSRGVNPRARRRGDRIGSLWCGANVASWHIAYIAAAQQFGHIWSETDINRRAGFMSTR